MKTISKKTQKLQVETLWLSLEGEKALGSFRRVDEHHPGDFYLSLGRDGRRGLVLISDEKPENISRLDSLETLSEQEDGGRWRTYIWLQNAELKPLFCAFADDLISASRTLPSQQVAPFTVGRIARWRRLFQAAGSSIMPLDELRGLIGELVILDLAFERYGPPDAIEAWCGPLDAPQDFAFADGKIEVKTVGPTALRARITSVDQLDVPSKQKLVLAVVTLASAAVDSKSGFAVAGYIAEFRSKLAQYPKSYDEFHSRLRAAGYENHPDYNEIRFRLDGVRYFKVLNGFPRLLRSDLMPGIADAAYEIELSAIAPYECSLGA